MDKFGNGNKLPDLHELMQEDVRLGNFATIMFESDQVPKERPPVDSDKIRDRFNKSIEVPSVMSKTDYGKVLKDKLKVLTTMHSIEAF